MTPRNVMLKTSAMSYQVKKATMISEGFRRLYNNDPYTSRQDVSKDLNRFSAKMLLSGYSRNERLCFIKRAIDRYDKKLSQVDTKSIPLYRKDTFDRINRCTKKVNKKTTWANTKDQINVVPLFVPCTPGGILKSKVEQVVKSSGEPIKVVEKGGKAVKAMLQRSNPGKSSDCCDVACLVCGQTEGGESEFLKGSCRSDGVNYTGTCLICQKAGVRKIYHGESSRNLFTRSREHHRDYNKKDSNNKHSSAWMKHSVSDHGGGAPSVRFQVTHCS
jgi:hypothetical protein